ncbi:MAG TPA: 2,3-bisphosphoglycerate-independent phosphoglycerate mutase [Clostridia bacterium]|nr:2,3-bisphosphoglycerate-independent phosphoglycerate mutase [Clostridia bacterium]
MKKMNALIILDGYGLSSDMRGNAIEMANKPFIDSLFQNFPQTTLGASGLDVGLPDGQMGNSEVGHLNMGAGRVVYQDLTQISKEIQDGDFFRNEALLDAMHSARDNGKKLHFYGLLGPGGVHSHIEHLHALLRMAKAEGNPNAYVHCFLDGRDVPPQSAAGYIDELQAYMDEIGFGQIATICGRFYAMDRDNRWDRVEKAYNMLTRGFGENFGSAKAAIESSYVNNITDEFVLPTVIMKNGKPTATICEGDSIIFFNFRPDRAREITRAFINEDFNNFERVTGFLNPKYVCFTRYDASFTNMKIAFPPRSLKNTLGEYLSKLGKTQLRIAETEKYAHVTFFFNGGVEAANDGEDRVLIPSPKVQTYDLQPEMSALAVTDKVVELVNGGKYDVMILNFANLDMVGHTGFINAAIQAVQTVDGCLQRVVSAILANGGVALVTADHGNADKMLDENGNPFTAHTTNAVPLIFVEANTGKNLEKGGKLCDVAPTLLDIMGIEKPLEMTGHSLLK